MTLTPPAPFHPALLPAVVPDWLGGTMFDEDRLNLAKLTSQPFLEVARLSPTIVDVILYDKVFTH